MVREWWRQRIQVLGIETDELLAIERQATPLTPFSRKESQELSESGPLPNGSRLSCGRLARRRKDTGRSRCPAGGTTLRFL